MKQEQTQFTKRVVLAFAGDYDEEYYKKLKLLADKSDRGVNRMALFIVRQYLDGHDVKVGAGF